MCDFVYSVRGQSHQQGVGWQQYVGSDAVVWEVLLWGDVMGARVVQGNTGVHRVQSCRCDRGFHPWSMATVVSGERRCLTGWCKNAQLRMCGKRG